MAFPRSSVAREHSDGSFPVQNVDHDVPVGAPESDVGRSAANPQTTQHDFIEKLRENGLPKRDASRAGGQTNAGLDEIVSNRFQLRPPFGVGPSGRTGIRPLI